jgi:hypothetical protein
MSGCRVRRVQANVAEFFVRQTAKVFQVEFAFPNTIRKERYEGGVLVLILAVDLLTKPRQVPLQFPQFGRLAYFRCPLLGRLDCRIQLLLQHSLVAPASNGPFRR